MSVWGGSLHLPHALLHPHEREEDGSSDWVWCSETQHCQAAGCKRCHSTSGVESGGESRAVDGGLAGLWYSASSEIRPHLVQSLFPARPSSYNYVVTAPLESRWSFYTRLASLVSKQQSFSACNFVLPWPSHLLTLDVSNFYNMCFAKRMIRAEHLASGTRKSIGTAAGWDPPSVAEAMGWIPSQLRAFVSARQRWTSPGSLWLGIVNCCGDIL